MSRLRWRLRSKRAIRNAVSISLLTFFVSLFFSGPVEGTLDHVSLTAGILMLLTIIVVAVITDILAVASVSAKEGPFHAMAVHRVTGATESIHIVRNGERMNSIFADVVGEVSGTVGGAAAIVLGVQLHLFVPFMPDRVFNMVLLGVVASLIVGGKALTKEFAVKNCVPILFIAGRVLHVFRSFLPVRHLRNSFVQVRNRRTR